MADVNANIGVNIDTTQALAQLKALQRQISQFHTSIAKSSETAALAQRDLQRNFINSINAIGAFSAELRTVRTTAESFTDSLEKNKFSMREYFRYAGGATRTFGKLFKSEFDTIQRVAEDRVKKLQTQYIKLGRDTSGAMKAIAVIPNELDLNNFTTQTQIAAQKQALFNQLMKQGSTNLLNFGKNTQWAGRQLMVGFTLPLATLGSTAARTFMEMEAAALKFRKVYGDLFTPKTETQAALENIKDLGKEFTKYGISVSQTVGLAADAAAAGFQGLDLQRQTTAATRLSVLGQIDNQKALETTISLQNAFRMSSADLASSIDFLNAVENQTVVSLDDITTAIPKVAPVIKQLGGDVKDLAFFLAAMKEGGVNASEGANALKSGLAALINPTAKASDMLAGLGINIKQIIETNKGDLKGTVVGFAQALDTLDPLTRARAIEQLFGKFQFARLSTLFTNVTNQSGQAARVLDLAGTSIEQLAALSEQELGMTADSAMNKFRKSVEDMKMALVPVGKTFLEAVTPIVEFIGNILEKFNGLSDGVKKAIVVMTVGIGAIGPVALMTFGLLANGLANIVKGAMILRQGYLRLTGQTQVLGEQTDFLTNEQLNAAAVAHSLDQSHARLVQTFNVERQALEQLIIAYQAAANAGAKFAAMNPGMMMPPRGRGFNKGTMRVKKYAGGVVIVPGSGNGDTVPAMLTPGEAVIPKDMAKQYAPLIQGMVAGNIPGYQDGLTYGDKTYDIPVRSGTSTATLEAVLRKFSKDVEGVSLALDFLEQQAKEMGTEFGTLNAKMLKDYLDQSGVVRRKGTAASAEGTVFAHAKAQNKPITDINEIKSLLDVTVDKESGFGKYLQHVYDVMIQGEKAVDNLAAAQQKEASARQELIRAATDAEKRAAQTKIDAALEEQQLALQQIKLAKNARVQTLSNYGFILPKEANMGKMSPSGVAEKFTGANIATTMAPIYEEYAQQLGMTLDQALSNPQVAAQMHSDIAQFARLLSSEIGKVPDEFLSDPEFYSAVKRAEEGLAGTVSQILINAIEDAKKTSTFAFFPSTDPTRQTEGQRVGIPQKQTALREQYDIGTGRSYLDVGSAGYKKIGIKVAEQTVQGMKEGAATNSASKKTIPIGEDLDRGLEVGMMNRADDVNAVAASVAQGAVQTMRESSILGPDGKPIMVPVNPPSAPINELTQDAAISQKTKDSIDGEIKARKSATAKLYGMNKALMGGTFALTALAGAGSMASGFIGDLSQQVMKYSGLLFGLMTITQMLTKESFLLYAVRLKETLLVGKFGKLLTTLTGTGLGSKIMGSALGRGATAVAGRVGLGAATAGAAAGTVGAGAATAGGAAAAGGIAAGTAATGGALLLVLAAAAAVAGTLWLVNKRQNDAIKEIEGLGKAAHIAASELEALKGATGASLVKTGFEAPTMFGVSAQSQDQVQQFQTAIKDSKELMARVEALKGATAGQAAAVLQSFGLELIARGMDPKTTQNFIKALAAMSGKAGVIASAKIELDTVDLKQELSGTVTIFDKAFNPALAAANKGGKDLEKNLTLVAGVAASSFNVLSAQFSQGNIDAKQFNKGIDAVKRNINLLGKTQALYVLRKALIDINPQMSLISANIKSSADAFKLLQMGAMGVDLSGFIAQIQAAGTVTDELRAKMDSVFGIAMKLASAKAALAAEEAKQAEAKGGTTTGADTGGTATKEDPRLASLRKAQAKLTIAAIIEVEKPAENNFKNRVNGIVESINKELKAVNVDLQIDPKSIKNIGDIDTELKRINMDIEKAITPAYRAAQFQVEDLKDSTEKFGHENEIINHQLDGMEKFYAKQKDALAEVGRLEAYNNAQRKRQITLADALTSGDISAAAQAAQEMQSAQAEFANETQQKALENNPELLALREQIAANDEKIWQINQQIYDIQKKSIDPVDKQIRGYERQKTLLNDMNSDYQTAIEYAKAKLKVDGMSAAEIEREIALRQAQLDLAGQSGGTITGKVTLTGSDTIAKLKAEIAELEKQMANINPTGEPITNWFEKQWIRVKQIWGNFKKWWKEHVWDPFSESPVGNWFEDRWKDMTRVWSRFSTWWSDNVTTPLKKKWNNTVENLGVIVETGAALFKAMGELFDEIVVSRIKSGWNTASQWFQTTFVPKIKEGWNTISGWVETNVAPKVKKVWDEYSQWYETSIAPRIKNTWSGITTWINDHVVEELKTKFANITEPFRTAFAKIGVWWDEWKTKTFDQKVEAFKNMFKSIFDPDTWKSWFSNAISMFASVFKTMINNAIINPLRSIRITIPSRIGGIPIPFVGGQSIGFDIPQLAEGGMIPGSGNSDNYPALLTPGEFVVNKNASKKFEPILQAMNNTKGSLQDFVSNRGARLPRLSAPSTQVGPRGGAPMTFRMATYNSTSSRTISPTTTKQTTVIGGSSDLYNYNVNINVRNGANANEIANNVITQIKQIDSQRIRGNRAS